MSSEIENVHEETSQEETILAARRILKPTPVRIGHVPRWFKKSGAFGPYGEISSSWLDHYGSTKLSDGRVAFVSEPYSVGADQILECEDIAKWLGLDFWVDPNSWWYPGYTIRLIFVQKLSAN